MSEKIYSAAKQKPSHLIIFNETTKILNKKSNSKTIAESKFYCFKIVANIFEVFYEF